jgi:DNA-binding MarR family transcriptional regulator
MVFYVQYMNNNRPSDVDHRSLQILDELSNNDSLTQRDLSGRLGIALGLVNTYIKNLVKKGYITVKTIPPKRYAYYLTPKGFTEKTRLTYHLLQDYTRIYREARSSVKKLFQVMEREGTKRVVFAGADEVAEIAYMSLQETGMGLAGVVDEERAGGTFFGKSILPMSAIQAMQHDCIVVTSYLYRDKVYSELLNMGINKDSIKKLFP